MFKLLKNSGINVAEYNDRKRAQIRNKNVGIVMQDFALLENIR